MFGYITAFGDTLQKDEKKRYQALYCGLCRALGMDYGSVGRATLTYDMTFVAMLLGSLYGDEEETGVQHCPINPIRRCAYVVTPSTRYAADMNILLSYYKYLDDWQDDGNMSALGKSRLLESRVEKARTRWPHQAEVIAGCLKALGEMERQNELNPDLPTNCFGALMGELLVMREDAWSDSLRRMGAALGRFIYLMDACLDLTDDIKKERYNPLVAQMDTDFEPMLTLMIGECTGEFEKLALTRDRNILRNVLYSGVWVKYKSKQKGKTQHDRPV